MTSRPRVLVLGGGFAGIGAARKLGGADVDVVLVDRHDYHTFQPLLYQLATGLLETTAVGHSLRDLVKDQDNAVIHKAPITGIDLDAKEVSFDGLAPETYDYLVLALGAEVTFFGTEGAAEHAFPMYTMAHALRLRSTCSSGGRRPTRTRTSSRTVRSTSSWWVAGLPASRLQGRWRSSTGTTSRGTTPAFRRKRRASSWSRRGTRSSRCSSRTSEKYAREALEKRTVEVVTGARVHSVSPTRVTLASGEVIPAHTLVWGAGLQGNSLVRSLGIELQHGDRIAVGPDLELPGHPGVFVVGDIAVITDARTGQALPQLGSVASSRASTQASRSPVASPARRRSRSPTATRAPWPRSGATRRSCRCSAGGR